uniref:hypothetical protein n=1 Tax=Schaedlerella arabinosiphila TaxID=2044587 RepID=UPI001FAB28AB|nr:hypothetical protein [Schaedlerella arabinosiphila]
MKSTQINWIRFTTILASRIIKEAIVPLNNADRENVLCIDESMFERNRSKKVEFLAKTYDHAKLCWNFSKPPKQWGFLQNMSSLTAGFLLLNRFMP